MKTNPISPEDLRGVFAVPALPRRRNAASSLDFAQNDRLAGSIPRAMVREYKTRKVWLDDQSARDELKNANPLHVWRMVDGRITDVAMKSLEA